MLKCNTYVPTNILNTNLKKSFLHNYNTYVGHIQLMPHDVSRLNLTTVHMICTTLQKMMNR